MLLDNAEWLRTGPWHPIGSNHRVWCHIDAEVPSVLVRDGGKGSAKGSRPGLGSTARGLGGVVTATSGKTPGVDVRGGGASQASVVVMAKGPRTRLIALAPDRKEVVRCGSAGAFGAEYVELRTCLARHFRSPDFSVSADGRVLREAWCDGLLLAQLPDEDQLTHLGALLESFANLTRAEATEAAIFPWSDMGEQLASLTPPSSMKGLLEAPGVIELFTRGPTVPSHGDLTTRNVMIDGSAQLVDFDDVRYAPFWLDLSKLLWRTLRSVDRETLAKSQPVQEGLDEIWKSGGLEVGDRPPLPMVAALFPLSKAWMEATKGGTRQANLRVLNYAYGRRQSSATRSLRSAPPEQDSA